MNATFKFGFRYGHSEKFDYHHALTKLDTILDELFGDFESKIDLEHGQVFIADQENHSITVYIQKYLVLDVGDEKHQNLRFRKFDSVLEAKQVLEEFLKDKNSLITHPSWHKTFEEILPVSDPEIEQLNCIKSLHTAAAIGNFKLVKKLIEEGSDIEKVDDDGATPILHAVLEENVSIIEYLIECGASLNKLDNDGSDIFELAGENQEIIALLNSAKA